MNTNIDTYSVTDLRHKTSQVMKSVLKSGYALLVRNSKPEMAMVEVGYLKALQQAHEDYLDMLEFDKTIKEKRSSLSSYLKKRS